MPQVTWLPGAIADIKRLHRFLKDKSPEAARRAAATIRRGGDILADLPEMGRPMGDGTGRRELFLPFGAGSYVLRYRLTDAHAPVILRVWHQKEHRN